MIDGQALHFSTFDTLFFAGSTGEISERCAFSIPADQRLRLASLLQAAKQRVVMGVGFDSFDFQSKLQDQSRATATFALGVKFGRELACSSFAEAYTRAVANALELNATDSASEDPLFVRTCAVEFNRSQCTCVAELGRAVYSDIYNREYRRSIIGGIVRNNLLLGLQISAQCGIVRY